MTITHALDLLAARLKSLPIPPEHAGRTPMTPLQQPDATPSQRAAAVGHLVGRAASLALLFDFAGKHAQAVAYTPHLRQELLTVAASAVLWLTNLTDGPNLTHRWRVIFDEIDHERAEQDLKFGPVHDQQQSASAWAAVLLEEAGEVAREVLQIERQQVPTGALRVELVHLAATAVAWLEVLPEETP